MLNGHHQSQPPSRLAKFMAAGGGDLAKAFPQLAKNWQMLDEIDAALGRIERADAISAAITKRKSK